MTRQDYIRAVSLAGAFLALMVVGGCASPSNSDVTSIDPAKTYPVTASPTFKTLQLSFATPAAGLLPQDELRFEHFVRTYRKDGTGAISISVPKGPDATAAVRYFGQRLAAMGVPRSLILVDTRTLTGGDPRVELNFITYRADIPTCGDWSENVGDTASNLPMPNFGCATQHDFAVQIANPRDLVEPRSMAPSDATRRSTVLGKYEAGKVTAATKAADQMTNVSGVQ